MNYNKEQDLLNNPFYKVMQRAIDYCNMYYNQSVDKERPDIEVIDNEIILSHWGCGVVIAYGTMMMFISEDDGHFYMPRGQYQDDEVYFNYLSSAWASDLGKAIIRIEEYLKEHGEPYYYSFGRDKDGNTIYSDIICGYTLKKKEKQ